MQKKTKKFFLQEQFHTFAKVYNNIKKHDWYEKNYLFFNVYAICFRFECK